MWYPTFNWSLMHSLSHFFHKLLTLFREEDNCYNLTLFAGHNEFNKLTGDGWNDLHFPFWSHSLNQLDHLPSFSCAFSTFEATFNDPCLACSFQLAELLLEALSYLHLSSDILVKRRIELQGFLLVQFACEAEYGYLDLVTAAFKKFIPEYDAPDHLNTVVWFFYILLECLHEAGRQINESVRSGVNHLSSKQKCNTIN